MSVTHSTMMVYLWHILPHSLACDIVHQDVCDNSMLLYLTHYVTQSTKMSPIHFLMLSVSHNIVLTVCDTLPWRLVCDAIHYAVCVTQHYVDCVTESIMFWLWLCLPKCLRHTPSYLWHIPPWRHNCDTLPTPVWPVSIALVSQHYAVENTGPAFLLSLTSYLSLDETPIHQRYLHLISSGTTVSNSPLPILCQ